MFSQFIANSALILARVDHVCALSLLILTTHQAIKIRLQKWQRYVYSVQMKAPQSSHARKTIRIL